MIASFKRPPGGRSFHGTLFQWLQQKNCAKVTKRNPYGRPEEEFKLSQITCNIRTRKVQQVSNIQSFTEFYVSGIVRLPSSCNSTNMMDLSYCKKYTHCIHKSSHTSSIYESARVTSQSGHFKKLESSKGRRKKHMYQHITFFKTRKS